MGVTVQQITPGNGITKTFKIFYIRQQFWRSWLIGGIINPRERLIIGLLLLTFSVWLSVCFGAFLIKRGIVIKVDEFRVSVIHTHFAVIIYFNSHDLNVMWKWWHVMTIISFDTFCWECLNSCYVPVEMRIRLIYILTEIKILFRCDLAWYLDQHYIPVDMRLCLIFCLTLCPCKMRLSLIFRLTLHPCWDLTLHDIWTTIMFHLWSLDSLS